MPCWLIKSEPAVYPWRQMVKDGKTAWTGVRNHQANNNMKAMRAGDQALFYHSGEGREIVGVVEVCKAHHPDPTDQSGIFGMVEVMACRPLKKPLTLAAIKAHPKLKGMALVRQPRLSVSPVTAEEWAVICALGGL